MGNPLTTMSRASFDNVLWNLNPFEFNYNNTIHNGTERYIYMQMCLDTARPSLLDLGNTIILIATTFI